MLASRLAKPPLRGGACSRRYRPLLAAVRGCSSAGGERGGDPDGVDGESPPRMLDLVLVRHGESEGNVAYRLSRGGDHSLYQGEFLKRHSSKWRLTDEGRKQAAIAGQWLKNHFKHDFDRFYVSEYLRAMETAARLDLPNAKWFAEVFLRERDWGQMDLMSWAERNEKMADELKRKDLDRFLYAPPGGESMADVALRVDRVLQQLHVECQDKRVIFVCHGEVMWALRARIERMSLQRYKDLIESRRMTDHIHNGQIIWYTRVHPETGEVAPYFTHMRSVCPWDLSLSINKWQALDRPSYTNGMLLATAEHVPRVISGIKAKPQKQPPLAVHPIYEQRAQEIANRGVPLDIKNALVVEKKTRYEVEREHYNADGDVLRRELTLRGIVYDRLRRSAEAHMLARDNIVQALESHGINVQVLKAYDLTSEHVAGADIVFTAGGDGTLLRTASKIHSNLPVVGVNTDPSFSQGSLCSCRLDMTGGRHPEFDNIVLRLLRGQYQWYSHTRLQVTIVNAEGEETLLPHPVLNEVLLSALDPAKPSILDVGIEDQVREVVRCSGIIVCTGTGSTAWFDSVTRVHADVVEEVLRRAGLEVDQQLVNNILKSIEGSEHFPVNAQHLAYAIREPIINRAYGRIRARKGHATRISLRTLGWDGQISIDGVSTFPFNFGVQAVIECAPEDKALRSVRFDVDAEYNAPSN